LLSLSNGTIECHLVPAAISSDTLTKTGIDYYVKSNLA
jgi:hypothetical protein